MTETVFKVKLSELTVVRIACRKNGCQGVIEVPVTNLVSLSKDAAQCPICRQMLVASCDVATDPLCDLGKLIDRLLFMESQFSIEFPVAVDPRPKP